MLALLGILGYIALNVTAIAVHGRCKYGSLKAWWRS